MKQSTIGTLKVLRDEEPKKLTSRIRLAWPEIKVALARGHTLKRIHAVLLESGSGSVTKYLRNMFQGFVVRK